MDIAHQLKEIALFVAEKRFVAILKKVTAAFVSQIEGHGVGGQKAPHEGRKTNGAGAEENVDVVLQQRPGQTVGLRSRSRAAKRSTKKVLSLSS
jgi:hypothetical protein